MGDAFLMRRRHRVGEWNGDLEELVQNETVVSDKLSQRLSANELHRKKVDAFRLFDSEHLNDIGVIERCDRLRFTLEPGPALLGGGQLRWEDLQRDLPIQLGVLSQINFSHAALTDLFQDLVVSEGLAEHGQNIIRSEDCGQFPQIRDSGLMSKSQRTDVLKRKSRSPRHPTQQALVLLPGYARGPLCNETDSRFVAQLCKHDD